MPRWASRFTLTVTDVRVLRVQEISEADVEALGFIDTIPYAMDLAEGRAIGGVLGLLHHRLRARWNDRHPKTPFEANPWAVAATVNHRGTT